MTPTDMEERLENIDHRLEHVEQILPTLATKDGLARLESRVEALDEKVTRRLDELDGRLNALDERLTGRLDGLDGRLSALDERLTGRLASVDTEVAGTKHLLEVLIGRLEARNVI